MARGKREHRRASLLSMALLAALIGQLYFFRWPDAVSIGALAWGAAIVALAGLAWRPGLRLGLMEAPLAHVLPAFSGLGERMVRMRCALRTEGALQTLLGLALISAFLGQRYLWIAASGRAWVTVGKFFWTVAILALAALAAIGTGLRTPGKS